MTLVVFDIVCLKRTVVKELGIFRDGIVLGYTFLPSNDYKPTFQAKKVDAVAVFKKCYENTTSQKKYGSIKEHSREESLCLWNSGS